MSRVEREKRFHDDLVQEAFARRHLAQRLAQGFNDKQFLWEPVWKALGDLEGKVVLDYGCGAGGLGLELAVRGAEVYGIDISEKLVFIANSRLRQVPVAVPPTFMVMDAHALKFPDGFFDFVFGNGVLHHLEIRRAYAEVARVLKPNGQAFFMEPLDGHPALRLFRRLTPQARTADERPLRFEDIEKARHWFSSVSHQEYYFTSVLAAPINLISASVGRMVLRGLRSFDNLAFKGLPFLRRYAWITLIRLEK